MKFLPGIAVGAASGSMGGVVASHNRGGQYFRRRATPVNPSSTYQAEVRAQLAGLSSGWRALTDEQRLAWDSAATSYVTVNSLGSSVQLTGQQLYIRANQRLAIYLPASMITVPPVSWEVEPLTGLALTDALVALGEMDTLTGTIVPAAIPANHSLIVRASPPLQAGIRFVKKYMRTIGIRNVTAGVFDITTGWNTRFGAVSVGQTIWLGAQFMNNTNGQVSPELLVSGLTEAAP